MAEFLDFDPHTGIAHYFSHDEMTNESKIHYVQDVQPIVDYAKSLANKGGTDKGIKAGWWKYAIIPAIVQVQLKQKGIDLNDPGSTKRIIEEINTNYPHLKCTQKSDGGKLKQFFVVGDAK
jgi:hypothetical protein